MLETPLTEVLASCPLSLMEFVNGMYIYQVGTCPNTVLGYATSMVPYEIGCDGNACLQPIETVLKMGKTVSGGNRPDSPGRGNGHGPIGTPPGQNKKLKAAAKRKYARVKSRLTRDLADHRNVKYTNNAFFFEDAVENDNENEVEWARANKEYSVALGDGTNLNAAQKFGGFDDQPQVGLVSATGDIQRLLKPGVTGGDYGGGGAVVVKLDVNIGGATDTRYFRLLQTTIGGVILHHGQECTTPVNPVTAATMVDRHVFLHSIVYDGKKFLVTTVDPLLDDTM
ncbi:MAG: hypothetical protein WBH28_12425 [Fuerstiella sp.]